VPGDDRLEHRAPLFAVKLLNPTARSLVISPIASAIMSPTSVAGGA
jgi:hypothetical protein